MEAKSVIAKVHIDNSNGSSINNLQRLGYLVSEVKVELFPSGLGAIYFERRCSVPLQKLPPKKEIV